MFFYVKVAFLSIIYRFVLEQVLKTCFFCDYFWDKAIVESEKKYGFVKFDLIYDI